MGVSSRFIARVYRVPLQTWLLCFVLFVCRIVAMHALFVYDDAFITFRYSRNLAGGLGFVYNPGERILGTTTPLFGLLLTPIYLLRLPMPSTVQWINIILDVGITLVSLELILKDFPAIIKILFALLFALSPRVAHVALGGMEMSLFLLFSLIAICLFSEGNQKSAIVITALSYFLRPEGGVLTVLLILLTFRPKNASQSLRLALIALGVVVVPLAIIYWYYGNIFSQSVIAKLQMTAGVHSSISVILKEFFAGDPLSTLLIPFAIYGLFGAWKYAPTRIMLLWVVAFTLFYCISRPYTIFSWYGEVDYYGILFLGSLGIGNLLVQILHDRVEAWNGRIAIFGALGVMACWIAIVTNEGRSPIETDVHTRLQDWCREHLRGDETILASDIGAIGYYSNAHIYDLYGLVSPQMLLVSSEHRAIQKTQPDYIYVTGSVAASLYADTNAYEMAASFVTHYPNSAFALLPHWPAEYHLLRRKQ